MKEIIFDDVLCIDCKGVLLKHKNIEQYVCFADCADSFSREHALENSNCVAVRDVRKLSFLFYSNPKAKVVFKRKFIKDLISGRLPINRFFSLQKAIIEAGYTSYDLS